MSAIMLALLGRFLIGDAFGPQCEAYAEAAENALHNGSCEWDTNTSDFDCTDEAADSIGDLYVACDQSQE